MKKKILVIDGMSNDFIFFETDAPKSEIEKWCELYIESLENGENPFLRYLQDRFYVELLADSEDGNEYDIDSLLYNEIYDLSDF